MVSLIFAFLIAIALGFLVAAAQGFFFSRAKAHSSPALSFGAGFMTGVLFQDGLKPILLLSLAGIVGWCLYKIIFPTNTN